VIVDFGQYRPGTPVRLINTFGAGPARDVLPIRVTGPAPDDTTVPAVLSAAPVDQAPTTTQPSGSGMTTSAG
jgi:hypothetical protein